jgi:hypothetical protein
MYVIPLLPEELLSGYRGRLRSLNDIPDSKGVALAFTRLVAKDQRRNRQEHSFAEAAASLSGLSLHDVVMQHTLWPFAKALGRPTDVAQIEELARSVPGRTAIMRCARRHAWFCMECVQEDLGFWHTSYWRRSHQLPGALWCDKHLSALYRVDQGAIAEGPPDHHLATASEPDRDLVTQLTLNPVVKAFVNLCIEVLTSGLTVSLKLMIDRVAGRLVGGNPAWSSDEAKALLSREARRQVPTQWFCEVFPRSEWPASGSIPMLDDVVDATPATSTAAFFLVAALAVEGIDEILKMLGAPQAALGFPTSQPSR